ncbi:HdeD family acid-resistance protein [Streptomyces cyanogenus]|uniref:Acid-resistance membrane protein n=1 Tax=Streptomyces cyanogenus TaxID=80860 RepID=A0ABX7TM34_STRCY|nr:HdeD family acid-resistance protein [Streptomyces cyanogenus]QTD96648.1 acid-resistance membrane protein [Streptomyces cyanogenus]
MTTSRDPAPPPGAEPPHGGTAAAPGSGPAPSPGDTGTVWSSSPPRPSAETGAAADGDPEGQLARAGGSWVWLLGSAVSTLVPGILALVWPDETLHVLAVLLGIYLLVTGGFRFVAAFAREHGDRHAGLLVAVVYVLAGVLCLRHPLQTIAALSLITGTVWLVSGMLTLWAALSAKGMPHRGFVLGMAALGIVAGIVVLALPTQSARALTRLLGLWLVLLGVAELGLALALRSALRRSRPNPLPGPPATA